MENRGGERYPFPQNKGYQYGILPDKSRDEMNGDMLRMYNKWKELYLTTEGCREGEYRVYGGEHYKGGTCSEGTGYGMLISVFMACPDNNAHEEFDGIFRFYKNHLVKGIGLMQWVTDKNGVSLSDGVAPDGDLDVTAALLLAHRQWGSNGEIHYLEEAKTLIGRLMEYVVNKPQYTISRDQITDPEVHYLDFTMSAYQMPAWMRLFYEVTGDDEWTKVIRAVYGVFDYFYKLNPETGLAPYTFMAENLGPMKGKAYTFSFDSCRVPWRVALDYLWNGPDETGLSHDYPSRNAAWFARYMESIDWDFDRVNAAFDLDGTPYSEALSPRNIVGMMAPAALVDESHRKLLEKSYAYLSGLELMRQWPGDYYQDALAVLGMLTLTGNMPDLYRM